MTPDALDCDQVKEQLHEYLRGHVTAEIAERIRRHLDDCRPCFRHGRFEESYLAMLEAKVKSQQCPEAARRRILDALRAEEDRGGSG